MNQGDTSVSARSPKRSPVLLSALLLQLLSGITLSETPSVSSFALCVRSSHHGRSWGPAAPPVPALTNLRQMLRCSGLVRRWRWSRACHTWLLQSRLGRARHALPRFPRTPPIGLGDPPPPGWGGEFGETPRLPLPSRLLAPPGTPRTTCAPGAGRCAGSLCQGCSCNVAAAREPGPAAGTRLCSFPCREPHCSRHRGGGGGRHTAEPGAPRAWQPLPAPLAESALRPAPERPAPAPPARLPARAPSPHSGSLCPSLPAGASL